MVINKHVLVRAEDAGNGYHGTCLHCGLALVTDLGFCSWTDVKCIDRKPTFFELPKELRSYAWWRGLAWDRKREIFVKPYTEEEYTVDELNELIPKYEEKES